jgi:hypothetical protein
VDEAAADQRRQPATPPVWTTTGPATTTTLSFCSRAAHQRRGLADGGFHLAFGGDAVGHEGEREAVALLGFRGDADAAHADHDAVALAQIAQAAAKGAAFVDHDHGVHALVFGFDPLVADAHVSAVVGGGVEIFGRAAVALHGAQFGVAGIDGRAAQLEQAFEQVRERRRRRASPPACADKNLRYWCGRCGIPALRTGRGIPRPYRRCFP